MCPFFLTFYFCPLVWKGRYSVSVMQPVFVDIHQLCRFFPVIYLSLAPTYIFFHFHLFIVFLFSSFLLHFTRSRFILYTFTSSIPMCPGQLSQYSEYNTSSIIGKSEFDFLPKQRYFCAPQPDYLWVPPSLLSNRFRLIFPWT